MALLAQLDVGGKRTDKISSTSLSLYSLHSERDKLGERILSVLFPHVQQRTRGAISLVCADYNKDAPDKCVQRGQAEMAAARDDVCRKARQTKVRQKISY